MKRLWFVILIFSLFSGDLFSQNATSDVTVGDTFTIGKVENHAYQHIHFPRANFIIKKGGIADYKRIAGRQVEITAITQKEDGTQEATIKLTSRGSFFNSHKYVTVDIGEAIKDGELVKS